MLSKLIKHEFRATRRVMLPVLGAVLLLSVLSMAALKVLDSGSDMQLLNTVSGIVLVMFGLSLFAVFVVAVVIMVQRFYKNLMRDEGYISMTLPVSVDEHIFAKLIVSFVWYFAVGIVCIAAIMIALSVFSSIIKSSVFDGLISEVEPFFRLVGVGNIIAFAFEILLLCFISSCTQCLQFYSAMAVGCAATEHKKLMSVLAFFGMSIALSVIQSNVMLWFVGTDIEWFENLFGMSMYFDSIGEQVSAAVSGLHRFILGSAVYSLIISAVYYFITRFFLKRKLNLA